MNPYRSFVGEYARLARDGKNLPLGAFANFPRPALSPDAPKALIFSPHPDDEVIIGGLALRLMREAKWNVINVAVTLGSKRQAERLAELRTCCECIGFQLVQTAPGGLENMSTKFRTDEPAAWSRSVAVIADILRQQQPQLILFPHEFDRNSAHIGTHFLVLDALRTMPLEFTCYTAETEFWSPMNAPNLMVEISADDLSDLITALTFHVGEVRRNPYHLSMPAWMIDNVRRGSELVGGQGAAAADFTFATLYRLRQWKSGAVQDLFRGGKQLSSKINPTGLFAVG